MTCVIEQFDDDVLIPSPKAYHIYSYFSFSTSSLIRPKYQSHTGRAD